MELNLKESLFSKPGSSLSVSPILIYHLKIMRLVGSAPLNITRTPRGRYVVQPSLRLLAVSLCGLFAIEAWYISTQLLTPDIFSTPELVMNVNFAANVLGLLAPLSTLRYRTETVCIVLHKVSFVEDNLKRKNFTRNDLRMLIVLHGLLFSWSISFIPRIFKMTKSIGAVFYTLFPYFTCLWLSAVFESELVMLTHALTTRAAAVAQELAELRRDGWRKQRTGAVLSRLRSIHRQQRALRTAARVLTDGFGFPVVVHLLHLIFIIILATFRGLRSIINSDFFTIFILQNTLISSWCIYLLVEPCHRFVCQDEAITRDIMRVLVHVSARRVFECSAAHERELDLFWKRMLLVKARPNNFMVMHMFSLNRNVFAVVAGTVCTYLVIMLQTAI